MIKFFYLEQSPYKLGKYTINMNMENFPPMTTEGSFNILQARLMGLTYANYLRMCRDVIGAEVIGKGTKYPKLYFNKDEKSQMLIRILNKRMELIIKVKNSKMTQSFRDEWAEEYYEEFGKEPSYGLGGDE